MKTRTLGGNLARAAIFVLLFVAAWTPRLSAENLVYVTRDLVGINNAYGSFYIDADSVIRNGDMFYFTQVLVYDTPDTLGVKKAVTKEEVSLAANPAKARWLESSRYDSAGKLYDHTKNTLYLEFSNAWSPYGKSSDTTTGKEITVALKYVK